MAGLEHVGSAVPVIPCEHCLAAPTPKLTLVEAGKPCRVCEGVTAKAIKKSDLRFILQAKLARKNKPLLRRLWAGKSERSPGYPRGIL